MEGAALRAGTAAGEDIVAGVMIRPLPSCFKQSANSGTEQAPARGWGRGGMIYSGQGPGETN